MHPKHRADPRHSERTHIAGIGAGIGAFLGLIGGIVIAGAPLMRGEERAEADPSLSAQSIAAAERDATVKSFLAAGGTQLEVRAEGVDDANVVVPDRERPDRFASREWAVR